jgi:hypothetical protein
MIQLQENKGERYESLNDRLRNLSLNVHEACCMKLKVGFDQRADCSIMTDGEVEFIKAVHHEALVGQGAY